MWKYRYNSSSLSNTANNKPAEGEFACGDFVQVLELTLKVSNLHGKMKWVTVNENILHCVTVS